MIHDMISEYGKVLDWYIEKYPGKEISLSVKDNVKKEQFEFLLVIEVFEGKFYTANSIEKKFLRDPQHWGSMKNAILVRSKRAILAKIEEVSK